MRVAAIDVGTNSTRLLVAEPQADGFRTLDRRMVITRLGQGVDATGRLAPEALNRTLATVADYAALCGELEVARIRVTGTSAVRDAANREEFFGGVAALTGRRPEMLSGEEEGRLTFLGALADLPKQGPVLVVDIGGGSTEFVYGIGEPSHAISIDIGCVRMLEKFIASDPPAREELDALREHVTHEIEKVRDRIGVTRPERLVGVAGTVTQLAMLKSGNAVYDPDVTHHAVLSHGDVRAIARRLESLDLERRRRIGGLEPGRADVIVAGAEILLAVLEVFDAPEVITSEKDILDGLVIDLLRAGDGTYA